MSRLIYIPRNQPLFTPIKYGALYNWYAATDSRLITSSNDWVVPTRIQKDALITYLGGSTIAGKHLKEQDATYWNGDLSFADNSSGFNGRGSGNRNYTTGLYQSLKISMLLWTRDAHDSVPAYAYNWGANYNVNSTFQNTTYKTFGFAVRLLYVGAGTPTEYVGNDLRRYRIIQIGSQFWLADNLAETKFRNGDWIHGFDGGTYTPISNASWAAFTTEGCCAYADDLSNV